MTRLDKWDRRFLSLARFVSDWSKDPSTQVGTVIADTRHRIVSIGFNGLPAGVIDTPDRLSDRETKLALTIHAEENALLFATRAVDGCAAYTWPMPPCAGCAAMLVQSGIKRVVSVLPSSAVSGRWQEEFDLAAEIYQEAGIVVDIEPMEVTLWNH